MQVKVDIIVILKLTPIRRTFVFLKSITFLIRIFKVQSEIKRNILNEYFNPKTLAT